MEFFVLSVEMWLKNSIKRIIDYDCQVFSFLFFLPLTPWWGRCALPQTWEWVKSGPWGPVRDDISWLYGSKTNTQTCPGASAPSSPILLLNGSNSIMSQHVCVCLSILQAKPDLTLLGSPAGLADVARDPCDPVTSTVMIRLSVCAAARWGVAALAASFPPALPGPWVMFGPEAEAGRRGFINSAEAWWAGKLLTFNVFRRAKKNKKAQQRTLISQMANGQSL